MDVAVLADDVAGWVFERAEVFAPRCDADDIQRRARRLSAQRHGAIWDSVFQYSGQLARLVPNTSYSGLILRGAKAGSNFALCTLCSLSSSANNPLPSNVFARSFVNRLFSKQLYAFVIRTSLIASLDTGTTRSAPAMPGYRIRPAWGVRWIQVLMRMGLGSM